MAGVRTRIRVGARIVAAAHKVAARVPRQAARSRRSANAIAAERVGGMSVIVSERGSVEDLARQ